MTLAPKVPACSILSAVALLAPASADVITPASVVSATATSDFLPASTLIDGSGLSSSVLTERTLHTVTHADAASAFEGWVTDFFEPEYFDATSTLPAPTLTFGLPSPTTIDGFAYWGYLYEGSFEGNEAKAFTLSFFDASGAPLGSPQTLESSEQVGPNGNVCSLTPVSNVKTITMEITDNFYPASGGERVGLSEVRFLGSEAPGYPLAAESSLGAGGTNGHDPYFGDYGQTVRLDQGNVVAAFSVRDNSSALPESADGEGYGCFFRVYLPDGSSVTGAPVAPYLDINPAGTDWQSRPLLAPLANGHFAIAWQDGEDAGGPNEDDLFVRSFSPTGVANGPSVQLGGATHEALFQDFGNLIALDDDGFAACWRTRDSANNGTGTSADGEGFGAFLQVFNADGIARSALIIPYLDLNPAGTGSQNSPILTALPGGLASTWNSAYGPGDTGSGSNSTSGGDTYARAFDNQGAAISPTSKAHDGDPTSTVDVQFPLSITASSGSYAVVLRDDNENTDNKDDFFIRFFSLPADPLLADFNGDDLTDFEDLILLREVIASGGGAGQPAFDLNGDTTVDLADLPLVWDSDFDGDGTQFGAELALGSDPNVPDVGSDKRLAPPLIDPSGDAMLSFGWDSTAPQGTRWVLKRSIDLLTFTPIFRYDGDSVVLGSETETTFDIINGFILYEDQDAPVGKAFYRFEAEFQPGAP